MKSAALEGRDRARFRLGGAEVALRRGGNAARVVPHRLDVRNGVARIGQRQDGGRRAEQRMGEVGRRLDRLHQRDDARDLVGDEAAQLLGRRDDGRSVARHLGGRQHEMDVVRIVAEAIHAHRRIGRRQVFLVHLGRRLVVGQRVEIAADPVVDVARHVHEVAGAGNGAAQPVGIGLGALRPVRRLHRVDVIVDRARMVRVARQHAFERRHDGAALRVRARGRRAASSSTG